LEGNLYYKMLKLTNGDTIICKTDDSCINLHDRPFVNIIEPIMLNLIRIPRQNTIVESYVLIPWISFTEDDVLEIPTSQILVAATPKKELISNYIEYTMYKDKEQSSDDMDVEETEDILEEMLNAIQRGEEDAEEEEERDGGITRGSKRNTKILH
jgi:hypothetical protein